jgi:hypothetical protein
MKVQRDQTLLASYAIIQKNILESSKNGHHYTQLFGSLSSFHEETYDLPQMIDVPE